MRVVVWVLDQREILGGRSEERGEGRRTVSAAFWEK